MNHGALDNGDLPLEVLEVVEKNQQLHFVITWGERKLTGFKPKSSLVLIDELKKKFPYFVINFYESKMDIFKK